MGSSARFERRQLRNAQQLRFGSYGVVLPAGEKAQDASYLVSANKRFCLNNIFG